MKYYIPILIIFLNALTSCNYLDVVPDNVATIDNAFRQRVDAEKYLFTCYSYIPHLAHMDVNPALLGADEFWSFKEAWLTIPMGGQNVISPAFNNWDNMYRAIRQCNIFLDNIGKVKDLDGYERDRWIAEVKFLKAYYHFYLMRMYGPIPLVRENLPISSDVEAVRVKRAPIDECVDYIVQLLNEAAAEENLPSTIQDRTSELGRITKPIVLALKAKVLVTAASPLFNGNGSYAGFVGKDGTPLFNPSYSEVKWDSAVSACKAAIDASHAAGHQLYTYAFDINSANVSPETFTKMSVRNSLASRWSPEVIWGDSKHTSKQVQTQSQARLDYGPSSRNVWNGAFAPTLKMAEMFYTENGVPIDEDKTWDYQGRYDVRTATEAEKYYIEPNYETASLHFDRESRFYASMAFDGAVWEGQGRSEDNPWVLYGKLGQPAGPSLGGVNYSVTGYWPKKLVNPESSYSTGANFKLEEYAWPIIRLADLYLLYAEALNEAGAPVDEVCEYINLVRERAGLNTVQESWSDYSSNPAKYQTQEGLREIIHQERAIELAFEGHRYWDLLRWKKASDQLSGPVLGWDIAQTEVEAYTNPRVNFLRRFVFKDYFWPISEQEVLRNPNLLQSPGW